MPYDPFYKAPYQYCLTISQMKWLQLFEGIPYNYVKDYNDDYVMKLDIEDVIEYEDDSEDEGGYNVCKKDFTFTLRVNVNNVSGGCMPLWMNQQYFIIKEYREWSAYDIFIRKLLEDVDKYATTIQALARGVLTRRKIHFALLSVDGNIKGKIKVRNELLKDGQCRRLKHFRCFELYDDLLPTTSATLKK